MWSNISRASAIFRALMICLSLLSSGGVNWALLVVCSIARARIQPSSKAKAAPEPKAPMKRVNKWDLLHAARCSRWKYGLIYQIEDDWHPLIALLSPIPQAFQASALKKQKILSNPPPERGKEHRALGDHIAMSQDGQFTFQLESHFKF